MSDHLGDESLLIAFICNHCPDVQTIGQRLAEDTRTLMIEGVGSLAVMFNDYRYIAEDAPKT